MARPNPPYRPSDGPTGEHAVRMRFGKRASGIVVAETLEEIVPTMGIVLGREANLVVDTGPARQSWRGVLGAIFRIETLRGTADVAVTPLEGGSFTRNGLCEGVVVDRYEAGASSDRRRPTDRERAIRASGPAFVAMAIAQALGPDYGPIEVIPKPES